MVSLSNDVPDASVRAAVLLLARAVEDDDGAPPLSDQALGRLGADGVDHVVALDGSRVVGYAQRADGTAEIVAGPAAVEAVLDAVAAPGLLVWTHGRRSRLIGPFERRDFERVRELHQLRRPLDEVADVPTLADGVTVRTFVPGVDDAAWLTLNAAAFAHHPEQGRLTQTDLDARLAEDWFDAHGFLLAERADELIAFHWTKVHPGSLGEVYVLGVDPQAQGLGLGGTLLALGLRHLREVGCTTVALYVDGDNPRAMHLYEREGFVRFDLDIQWNMP